VLLGAPVGAASGMPYRIKAHGSELEYAMRGRPDLAAWGANTLAGAEVVYAGSEHIREVLDEVCGHTEGAEIVPPRVHVEEFRPEPRGEALAALLAEADDVPVSFGDFFAEEAPTVLYFGKLIENKGVQVLLEALDGLDARAVIVGFGDYRAELERLAREGT